MEKTVDRVARSVCNIDFLKNEAPFTFNGQDYTVAEAVEVMRKAVANSFLTGPDSTSLSITLSDSFPIEEGLPRASLRIWGEQIVIPLLLKDESAANGKRHVGNKVIQPRGVAEFSQVCSYMKIKPSGKSLAIPSLLIRTDGEGTFIEPECIAAKEGFLNVTIHEKPYAIFSATLDQARLLRFINYELKRKRAEASGIGAEGYCKFDPVITKKEVEIENTVPCFGCSIEGSEGNLCRICSSLRRVFVPKV